MWDLDVPYIATNLYGQPYEGQTLRKVAASAGFDTRDAYVNAVSSDAQLAAIAVQRAVEETAEPFNHARPGPVSNIRSAE